MNSIEAVIFDLDGTLIDSMGVWVDVDKEFLNKRGIAVPDNLFCDMPEGNSFFEVATYFINKFGFKESEEEIMAEWTSMVTYHYENDIKLKPGVLQLLNILKQHKIKIGVGTSNSMNLAKKVLINNGVLDYFDTIVVGTNEIKGKPFPDIFINVANNLGVKYENCLVLEDVYVGVKAAINAGMQVFGIKDKYAEKEWDKINSLTSVFTDDYYLIMEEIKKIINSEDS